MYWQSEFVYSVDYLFGQNAHTVKNVLQNKSLRRVSSLQCLSIYTRNAHTDGCLSVVSVVVRYCVSVVSVG